MTTDVITVLLADDHTIVRQGLAKLLEGEPDIKIVGEAENGRESVKKAEELKPHVVVMDIAMPLLNGIEATRQIIKSRSDTKVIILSMHAHDRYISELFSLGASGYLLKDATGRDIIKAIRAALTGGTYLSP
ncbi:MAG: response regulator transcription factor, partial [Deltaproteobacteria bacterium]|nr:response regulator transcription factor [Deltaproteobacteria bacterium]